MLFCIYPSVIIYLLCVKCIDESLITLHDDDFDQWVVNGERYKNNYVNANDDNNDAADKSNGDVVDTYGYFFLKIRWEIW